MVLFFASKLNFLPKNFINSSKPCQPTKQNSSRRNMTGEDIKFHCGTILLCVWAKEIIILSREISEINKINGCN